MNEETGKKMGWLRSSISGDIPGLIVQLRETLPATDRLDAAGEAQLQRARDLMAELWMQGVSLQRFLKESGMTGFPVDPKVAGLHPQLVMGDGSPTYFTLWLADKDPAVAVEAVKTILTSRFRRMADYAGWYRMQLYVDIDTESKEFPMPYEAALTPQAVCMEFGLADFEANFARIEAACRKVAPHCQQKVRIGLGSFAQQEFYGFSTKSLYGKRIPFNMGMEWILFKSIHRRAGRLGWFWRFVAKWQDRRDDRPDPYQQ